jgi:hypothetical protein
VSILNHYYVESIKSKETHDWLLNKHYAKRIPPITYAFGIFDRTNCLQGVITFGTPVSSTLRNLWHNQFKLMELNRLVVNEGLEKNVLSFFLSTSLKRLPNPLVLVSYADSSQNHHGYIYQATNWIYTGLSIPFKDVAVMGMENMHHSTIEDLARGRENKMELLKKMFGDRLYRIDRPRKHRYFYLLGSKKEKREMNSMFPYKKMPYPKGDNKRYDSSYVPLNQEKLFNI